MLGSVRIIVQASQGIKKDPISKITNAKRAEKYEFLSSSLSTTKRKKRKKRKYIEFCQFKSLLSAS
jgi:hypothetical protein